MQLSIRHIRGEVLWMALTVVMMVSGIHVAQEFRFYNIESNNLFIYDWDHILTTLRGVGGLSSLMASFFTQFMRINFAGTLILTSLYLITAYFMYRILAKVSEGPLAAGLSFLPAAFLFLCMENDYYRFQGHISFLIVILALYLYASLSNEKSRTIYALVLIPVLYHAVGSAVSVFAVSVLFLEFIFKGVKGSYALIYPALSALVAYLYVKKSVVPGWEYAMTPFMYYDWPSTYFFPAYAWVMVPLLIIIVGILSHMGKGLISSKAAAGAALILSFFIAGNLYSKVHAERSYHLLKQQYWAEKGDWDRIIRTADRRQPTYFVSYLNLALAQKGLLVPNYKYYNPQDLSSIMYPTPNLKTGLTLQSTVYQAWDYHAAARQAAFDANIVTPGANNPRQLQVLVKSNIALGAYEVAEKYISILEKTLFYRTEAEELRSYMSDPTDVILPLKDEYARYDGMKGDMRDILEVAPSHYILSQFYQLYQILEKEGK